MKPSIWPAGNSGLAQLGFEANLKVGFVLGSSDFNLYIRLIKSPTDAKPRDVSSKLSAKKSLKLKLVDFKRFKY